MRLACATTTIHDCTRQLRWFEACDKDVPIFIAGDLKTPMFDMPGNATYYSPDAQRSLGYKSSELIGWNNDSRRNIAVLEALKWGADVIVSLDDDMIPMNKSYFDDFRSGIQNDFTGLQLGEAGYWFDPGSMTIPKAPARGLPPDYGFVACVDGVSDAKVGVVQGLILGKPDTSAVYALANSPLVTGVNDVARHGFVIHPEAFTVFNSQTTAFRRDLAPCFAQFYNALGRNTDIYASLIMRRVMREHGLFTYYGPPMAYHARSPRKDVLGDIKAEMFGVEHVADFATTLANISLPKGSFMSNTMDLWAYLFSWPQLPRTIIHAVDAWLEDVEGVL